MARTWPDLVFRLKAARRANGVGTGEAQDISHFEG
jgi:hypothetical protein